MLPLMPCFTSSHDLNKHSRLVSLILDMDLLSDSKTFCGKLGLLCPENRAQECSIKNRWTNKVCFSVKRHIGFCFEKIITGVYMMSLPTFWWTCIEDKAYYCAYDAYNAVHFFCEWFYSTKCSATPDPHPKVIFISIGSDYAAVHHVMLLPSSAQFSLNSSLRNISTPFLHSA